MRRTDSNRWKGGSFRLTVTLYSLIRLTNRILPLSASGGTCIPLSAFLRTLGALKKKVTRKNNHRSIFNANNGICWRQRSTDSKKLELDFILLRSRKWQLFICEQNKGHKLLLFFRRLRFYFRDLGPITTLIKPRYTIFSKLVYIERLLI